MLSIKLGYGRPAFLAAAIAERLRLELIFLGLPKSFGRFFPDLLTHALVSFFLAIA